MKPLVASFVAYYLEANIYTHKDNPTDRYKTKINNVFITGTGSNI